MNIYYIDNKIITSQKDLVDYVEKKYNISKYILLRRLRKGFTMEQLVKPTTFTYNDVTYKSLQECCRALNISYSKIQRFRRLNPDLSYCETIELYINRENI